MLILAVTTGGRMSDNDKRELLSTLIACVVTVVWSTSYILDVMMTSYEQPAGFTPIMSIIVTGLFGGELVKRVKDGKP